MASYTIALMGAVIDIVDIALGLRDTCTSSRVYARNLRRLRWKEKQWGHMISFFALSVFYCFYMRRFIFIRGCLRPLVRRSTIDQYLWVFQRFQNSLAAWNRQKRIPTDSLPRPGQTTTHVIMSEESKKRGKDKKKRDRIRILLKTRQPSVVWGRRKFLSVRPTDHKKLNYK